MKTECPLTPAFIHSFAIHPTTPAPAGSASDLLIARTSAGGEMPQRPNGVAFSPAISLFTD
jgi:hypothetical protein